MKKTLLVSIVLLTFLSCSGKEASKTPAIIQKDDEPGSAQATSGKLPAWQEGYLDIHFINTGRGECTFYILPDGTQVLVDAGASIMPENYSTNLGYPQVGIAPKPNDSKVAGYWCCQYMRKCMEWTGNEVIDFALTSHFDGDHIGVGYEKYGVSVPRSPYGDWLQTGLTYVLDNMKVGVMIDRGYPSYDYPYPLSGNNVTNLRKCADYHADADGMKREGFKVGSASQIVMKRNPDKYGNFMIRNIYVNGECWTGSGEATRQIFPDKSTFSGTGGSKECSPCENSCSCIIKLSYGKFDYYSGGDAGFNGISSYAWKDVETPVSQVVGEVDVMKATHHGSADGCSQTLLTNLSPSDIIVNVWQAVQPRAVTFERMCSSKTNGGKSRIYTTTLNKEYAKEYGSNASRILASQGHIVVRVEPGGNSYCIYQIDDSDADMGMDILKAFGPYTSK